MTDKVDIWDGKIGWDRNSGWGCSNRPSYVSIIKNVEKKIINVEKTVAKYFC